MEFNVTQFFNNECARDFQASRAEIGDNAGRDTWNAALESAEDYKFITEDNRPTFEGGVLEYGAWGNEEIEAWTLVECNALMIQFIAGDIREFEDVADYDWEEYEREAEAGSISGNLFISGDEYYYQFGG